MGLSEAEVWSAAIFQIITFTTETLLCPSEGQKVGEVAAAAQEGYRLQTLQSV